MSAMSASVGEVEVEVETTMDTVEFAKCECCGLTEECTVEYIARVRERHHGRWICGLCAEAVKDEICRSDMLITTEEALDRHTTFRSSPPPQNPTAHLISAVRQLVRRSFESPRLNQSMPSTPRLKRSSLSRSESCFPALAN